MQRCFFTRENTAISFFTSALSQVKNTIFFCILIMNEVDCWKLHRTHPCSSLVFWQGTPDLIKCINFIYSTDPHWAFNYVGHQRDRWKACSPPRGTHSLVGRQLVCPALCAARRHVCASLEVPSGWTDRRRTWQGPQGRCCLSCNLSKGEGESAEGSGGPFKSREWGAQGQGDRDT